MNRTYLFKSMWQIIDQSLLFNLGKLREMIELQQYFLQNCHQFITCQDDASIWFILFIFLVSYISFYYYSYVETE